MFNSPYVLWEGAEEVILPGAFADCLGQDVRALINHDSTLVLGRTIAGTLTLREDETGLWGSVRINRRDADAMNLHARVARGDVNQCSFGFDIREETFEDLGGGRVRWSIAKVDPLYEVSICTFPAYEATSVSARERDYQEIKRRQLETRKAGLMKRLKGE